MSGVLAGNITNDHYPTFCIGSLAASGGVYALLAAHVANVFLNYAHIDCGLCWVIVSIFIGRWWHIYQQSQHSDIFTASCDVAFAIWDRYVCTSGHQPTSYAAHLSGAIAGLSLGFMLLKCGTNERHSYGMLWWCSSAIYCLSMCAAIVCNIFVFWQRVLKKMIK
jgi:rhomboid-related protein 1/2/3